MRCGVVSLSDPIWEEPHPHVVVVHGHTIIETMPDVTAWLGQWPRLIWTGGTWPRCFLPATARAGDLGVLEALELAGRRGQEALSYGERLRRAGVPATPAPAALPAKLTNFSILWNALQCDDATPLDVLVAQAGGWAGPVDDIFLRRPTHLSELLDLLQDSAVERREVGYGFVERLRIANDAVLDALRVRLQATDHGPQELHRLLIAIGALRGEARKLAPTLRAVAEKWKGDYYQHKRLSELAALVEKRA
jgi:hypothetical protein